MDIKLPGQSQETPYQSFEARASGIDAAALSQIGDDTLRERMAIKFATQRARSNHRIELGRERQERAQRKSAALLALQGQRNVFLSEDASAEQKMEAWDSLHVGTMAAYQSGVFSPGETERVTSKYLDGTANDYAEILKQTDLDRLSAELDDDEGPLKRMDPVKRATMRAYVTKEVQLNGLLVDIADGKAGLQEIATARQDGWLRDYDDINLATGALEKREKAGTLIDATRAISDPLHVWDPTDSDDKKRVNAVIESNDGLVRLMSQEEGYLDESLAPLVQQTGMIPNSVKGALLGMLRSNDDATVVHALSTLDALERINPLAFSRDAGADMLKQVERYRDQLAFRQPEEIAADIRQSEDPSRAKAREAAEDAGKKLAGSVSDSEILDFFDPGWFTWGPDGPLDPLGLPQLRNEFELLFAEEFAAAGNKDIAAKNAVKLLGTVWGSTDVGAFNPHLEQFVPLGPAPTLRSLAGVATRDTKMSARRLMRFPPERYYPSIDGSHDWMQAQAKTDLAPYLESYEAEEFSLVSDAMTEAAIGRGAPPSYQVVLRDKDGVFVAVPNVRLSFDPKPFLVERRERYEKQRKATVVEDELLREFPDEAAMNIRFGGGGGPALPPG